MRQQHSVGICMEQGKYSYLAILSVKNNILIDMYQHGHVLVVLGTLALCQILVCVVPVIVYVISFLCVNLFCSIMENTINKMIC